MSANCEAIVFFSNLWSIWSYPKSGIHEKSPLILQKLKAELKNL